MKWCEFISEVYAARQNVPGMASKPVSQPPAFNEDITAIELQLHAKLPTELHSLLRETNGILELMKIDVRDWFENIWLLWSVERIISDNLAFRRESAQGLYEGPFQDLLVFSNAGTDGILFAHPVTQGQVRSEVVAWYPPEVELRQIASSLKEFLEGWLLERIML
jgi:hypothetical protein